MNILKPDHDGVTTIEVHNPMEMIQAALTIGFSTVIGQWVNEGKLTEAEAAQGAERALTIAGELTLSAEHAN